MRAVLGALAAGVLPGYFWAGFLRPAGGLGERLAYSAAISMASVPVLAIAQARLFGTGVTLWLAIASIAVVLGSGAVALVLRGAAAGRPGSPVLPRPAAIRDVPALALIVVGLGLALASALGLRARWWLLLATLIALIAGGVLAAARAGTAAEPAEADIPDARPEGTPPGRARAAGTPAAGNGIGADEAVRADTAAIKTAGARHSRRQDAGTGHIRQLSTVLREPVLAIILALTAVRAYAGPVRHDWPYLRGSDQFSHAVMAQQMLAHGSYGTYMIYPPGFSALTAVICRVSGLTPLTLFPVLAPALLVLTTLAAYALATRLWGWEYGLAAAALSGLVLRGPYASFAEGRYPDLTAAYFLLMMLVAALITLLAAPSVRSILLVAVTGAAVVLYHSVAGLYLALLLAAVAAVGLPYLLVRRRAEGAARLAGALALGLASLGALAAAYAAYTYLPGRSGAGASGTSTAVSIALGSQPVLSVPHVLTALSSSVVWLGVLGLAALVAGIRYLRQPGQVVAALTVALWCGLMYAGSRTAADGFPQRFERDLGGPLAVLGALGAGLVLRSLVRWRPPRRAAATLAAAAAAAVIAIAGLQAARAALADAHPVHVGILDPDVAAAGAWLRQHNTGGTIISTPAMNPGITNRAVLAMGGYTGLQSYSAFRIAHPRSLPAAGRAPLLDSREVLLHPASCRVPGILAGQDVRYIVLYRFGHAADLAGFRADQARYRRVFENPSVVIYAPARVPCPA